jgi:hypothetical protein
MAATGQRLPSRWRSWAACLCPTKQLPHSLRASQPLTMPLLLAMPLLLLCLLPQLLALPRVLPAFMQQHSSKGQEGYSTWHRAALQEQL